MCLEFTTRFLKRQRQFTRPSTIQNDDLAGHKSSIVTGEVDCEFAGILGFADTAGGGQHCTIIRDAPAPLHRPIYWAFFVMSKEVFFE